MRVLQTATASIGKTERARRFGDNKQKRGEASPPNRVGGEPVETDPLYLRLRAHIAYREPPAAKP